jgi:hypothetical protein
VQAAHRDGLLVGAAHRVRVKSNLTTTPARAMGGGRRSARDRARTPGTRCGLGAKDGHKNRYPRNWRFQYQNCQ